MNKQHWTAYWQTGVLTSLPNDFKENYDGELAAFWARQIDGKQTSLDVLDVCTGNGAVAILFKELAADQGVTVNMTAVDASHMDPQVLIKHHPGKANTINDITFIGDTMVEELEQSMNQTFDLIISQYGLEYCDTALAAPVIAGLLNESGRLVFVSHAADTAILSYMREEEQIYQLFDHAGGWDMLHRFARNQLSVNGFKNKLNDFLNHIKGYTHLRSMPLYNRWGEAMVQLFGMSNKALKEQRSSVARFLREYQHARARANDMLQVSDKLTEHPQWYRAFEQHGLKLTQQGVIHQQGTHIAGHSYEFVKTR